MHVYYFSSVFNLTSNLSLCMPYMMDLQILVENAYYEKE